MSIAIYPGSFDPITLGHLDIIKRASKICDKLIIAVSINSRKKSAFSVDQRIKFLNKVTKDLNNVEVKECKGLTADFAKYEGVDIIIRGLRAITDFEYELQMAQINSKLEPEIETVFMATKLEYAYLSSSIVKEVAAFNGDISSFIPEIILEEVESVLKGENNGHY